MPVKDMDTSKKRGRKPETQMARPLPNRMREMRLRHGLTMQEVADRLKITVGAVQKAETLNYLSTTHRYEMALIYRCHPYELEKTPSGDNRTGEPVQTQDEPGIN